MSAPDTPRTSPSSFAWLVYTAGVEQALNKKGLAAAFAAHGLWGLFPLYFNLLNHSNSVEIVSHRLWWTLIFCIIGITLLGAWHKVRQVMTNRRVVLGLLGAGVLVSVNWLIYIFAVVTGHVIDAALGYYINPLVTAILAIVVLKERISTTQIVALSFGAAAVLVIAIGVGQIPWIGLGLAFTFGFYALVKNRIGAQVTPVIGLGIEALALAPLSGVFILVLEITRQGTLTTVSWPYALLLAGTGIVTALPLLCFAVAAQRLPLATLGFIQYVTPTMQFIMGVALYHESMPPARWVGFVLVWVALVILSWDMIRRARA